MICDIVYYCSDLVAKANFWLSQNLQFRLQSCETVSISVKQGGVANSGSSLLHTPSGYHRDFTKTLRYESSESLMCGIKSVPSFNLHDAPDYRINNRLGLTWGLFVNNNQALIYYTILQTLLWLMIIWIASHHNVIALHQQVMTLLTRILRKATHTQSIIIIMWVYLWGAFIYYLVKSASR